MRLIYDDQKHFEFVETFGYHRCFREKKSGALILVCRTNAIGNTVSINNQARRAFLAFEPAKLHSFHLATPIRELVLVGGGLPPPMPLAEYTVYNIDELIAELEGTQSPAKAS